MGISAGATATSARTDVAIVGAGIAGLYALYKLRSMGIDARIFEAGSGVGGTWFWNRYPGARCDVESYQYSYSFSDELQQEWTWSERFSTQSEIRAYLNHVADRYNLRDRIVLDCRIEKANFDSKANRWRLTASNGMRIDSRFCIMATGILSKARDVAFPDQHRFKGTILKTSDWPEEHVDLTGKRVALIGTGATGTQMIPHVADQCAELTVFQRTPNFCVPSSNAPVDEAYDRRWKKNYGELRRKQKLTGPAVIFDVSSRSAKEASAEERRAEFERRWTYDGGLNFMRAFCDLSVDEQANTWAAEFVREKIKATVKNPEIARKLLPFGYPIDARRLATADRNFYAIFNRPNVKLVSTLEEPILGLTEHGIRTAKQEYPADVIVTATGFDAMVGALMDMELLCTDGRALSDTWQDRPGAYLGISIAGLPNLFVVNGPGSPGALANLFTSSELIVDWIANFIDSICKGGVARVDVDHTAQNAWMDHVQALAAKTLMVKAPTSGYIYRNSKGERIFLCYAGGFSTYRAEIEQVAGEGYRGFLLTRA